LNVNDVKANPAVSIQPPPSRLSAAAAAASVQTEKVTEGVYYLKGGTHHSVAIEFSDHVVMVEGPVNEQRSLAVIEEVKRLIPGKPIRYVVNTHHHFDHSGGLRTYVNEGVTILTHQTNADFYARAFATQRTLSPDRLEQSRKKAGIEPVSDRRVLTDGARTLELHVIKDSPHHDGILMVFLPKEKIVIEVDVYTPSQPNAPGDVEANPNTVNFVDNLEKLRLDFEKILPLHGVRSASRDDLYAAVRKPVPDITQILNPPPVAAAAQGQRGQRGGAAAARSDTAMATLLSVACAGCHSLQRISNAKGDAQEWTETVERMKGKGAELTDEETRALIDYLARTYN
jgi:glyoxylase-like metal-dependent hydrolase (beta-lactamase superfamily II)